ncbi:MAG: hypothetical protein J7M40_13005 [Planctomycetes bacterium]|nr:hypothetical protein [Planctomycetota bacterium]
MKILTLDEAGVRFGGKVFRSMVFPAIVVFVAFASIGIGLFVNYWKDDAPLWALIVFEPAVALFLLLMFGMVRKGFKSTNWLMVLSADEVLIKYRSYLNCHLSRRDRQVFVMKVDQIGWVRKVKRKEITFGMRGGKQTAYLTFLDIMLAEGVGEDAKEALVAEQRAREYRKTWYGSTRSKSGDYPVSVKDDNILRVKMSWVRPGVKAALRWFGANGVEERPICKEAEDFTATGKDKKQMDDKILTLAMGGKKIAAVKLARRAYGMGLSEAKNFVEGLIE